MKGPFKGCAHQHVLFLSIVSTSLCGEVISDVSLDMRSLLYIGLMLVNSLSVFRRISHLMAYCAIILCVQVMEESDHYQLDLTVPLEVSPQCQMYTVCITIIHIAF